MEEKIKEPISELYEKLAEVKRRPLSSFVPLNMTVALCMIREEEDVNE